MRRYTISDARSAAEAFMDAVDALEEREKTDDHFRRFMGICGFKETAAVRRASMTLTRALAEMRKP
jgi:hypothetical protein